MFKYIFLVILAFPVQAYQTKQEIIEYCTRVMLQDGGNETVLLCIQQELTARDKIIEIAR